MTMTDLYETLGVAKDATKEAIKRAFRSKAKAAHPDTGGSTEKFHAIELAHRVLSDDERRAEYDRNGTVDEQPNRQEDATLSIIAAFVDRFLSDENFKTKDMIGQFRRDVGKDIGQVKDSIKEADAFIARCLNAQTRLKGKAGAELINKMIANKIRQAEDAKRMLDEQIKIRERALEIVADASFDFDKMPQSPFLSQSEIQDQIDMLNRARNFTGGYWR